MGTVGSGGETTPLDARVALSFAAVLAPMCFIAKRLGGRTEQGRLLPITVLGRHRLGRRSGVAVVEVGGQALLLGVSDTRISTLRDVPGAWAADDGGTDDPAAEDDDATTTPPPSPHRSRSAQT